MKNVLFIHSAGPQGNGQGSSQLLDYLQKSLRLESHFYAPVMPSPENPSYEQWRSVLNEQLAGLQEDITLIGHSLGGSVLLKYLSEEACSLSISGLFVMGSPCWGLDEEWPFKEFQLSDDFSSRLSCIQQIYLYHSRNDEVVPFSHLEHYSHKLPNAKTRIFDQCGHLFQNELPELIQDINALWQGA
ncbi:alpha/beta hydrolase [Halobacillus sp. A5]|uniref:alpha/beta hydrolase n=1 Tax=Halobacillus sp. A5 TaxID=2880263 RepID=UPI0020A6BAAB|nr:alpha/beta hydrolase [Halobacillus sp. A5]MCP3027810.1 alpha/beta hydrolase [Halobacillus sp. A5]